MCFQVSLMLISGWNGFHNFLKMKLPNSPILLSYHQKLTLSHPTAQGIIGFMWNSFSIIIHSQYHLAFFFVSVFVCVLQFISILISHLANPNVIIIFIILVINIATALMYSLSYWLVIIPSKDKLKILFCLLPLSTWYKFRVRMGHGKPGNSWNLSISVFLPGKPWNFIVVGHCCSLCMVCKLLQMSCQGQNKIRASYVRKYPQTRMILTVFESGS